MCKPRHTPNYWEGSQLVHFDDQVVVHQHPTEKDLFIEVPIGLKPGDRGCRVLHRTAARWLDYID